MAQVEAEQYEFARACATASQRAAETSQAIQQMRGSAALAAAQMQQAGVQTSTWSPAAASAADSAQRAAGSSRELANALATVAGQGGPVTSILGQLALAAGNGAGAMGSLRAAFNALPTALLAVGIGQVITQARELSAEIDQLNEKAGTGKQGFIGNLGTGWGELLGTNAAPGAAAPDLDVLKAERAAKIKAAEEVAAAKIAADAKAAAAAEAADQRRRSLAVQAAIAQAAWEERLRGKPGTASRAEQMYGSEEWAGLGANDDERWKRLQIMDELASEKARAAADAATAEKKAALDVAKTVEDAKKREAAAAQKAAAEKIKTATAAAKAAADDAKAARAAAVERADASRARALLPERELRNQQRAAEKDARDKARENRKIDRLAQSAQKKLADGWRDPLTRREQAALQAVRDRGAARQAGGVEAIATKQLATLDKIEAKIGKIAGCAP